MKRGLLIAGLAFLSAEMRPYAMFFAGVALISLGSAYYHLAPDDTRPVWDRLPMTIALLSLVAAVIAERISLRAGNARRRATAGIAEPEGIGRVLATMLFVDIVASTPRVAALGDRAWRELLESYQWQVRSRLKRHGGREIDMAGDGLLAAFDGPTSAILCASAIREAAGGLGLEIRAGVHAGECESMGERLSGIAVHVGARVAAKAEPGEIVVSRTVKDLVTGSGLTFIGRGAHALSGVPGEWPLYAFTRTVGEAGVSARS